MPIRWAAALFTALWLASCGAVPANDGGPVVDTDRAVPVALLVPSGSGNSSDEMIARALQQAARLAISDLKGGEIDLRVYSTGGKPAVAGQMAAQAVDEGAKIILGPVYAEAANAAGVAVAQSGINVLSFSNNTSIAGGNVFVLGPTFENAANRLVTYAARHGKRRIFIVSEQTMAGKVGHQAISAAISRSQASLAGSYTYEFSRQGVMNAVTGIVSQVRGSSADVVFFTANTAGALPLLSRRLHELGLSSAEVQFVGLTRWDIPAHALALPGIQGGWFALPDPGRTKQFERRYSAVYGTTPHSVAGLAYDGIAAIGALLQSGDSGALTRSSLIQGRGFAAVSGNFRLRADGTNERALAVGEIRNNQIYLIAPAPDGFDGARI